ncbi:MAG: 50S ribosomal protein L18 [SAR324 cluster bacterium]|nr:50S ribosomal protein L18 [SAR324 cluster bacterium]
MEAAKKRIVTRQKKKASIRSKLSGTTERPRVSVFRSSKHIYAQAIDDSNGKTLASVSSLSQAAKGVLKSHGGNKEAAQKLGELFGKELKEKGIESILFDRNGYLYHGRVQSLADGIREAGIKF